MPAPPNSPHARLGLRHLAAALVVATLATPTACGVAPERRGRLRDQRAQVAIVLTGNTPAPASTVGCADGQREGFVDVGSYPDIAGCSGGWTSPGIMAGHSAMAPACPQLPDIADSTRPACGRGAGDDGNSPGGDGCTVSDLCAAGWHVCTTASEVALRAPRGCRDATRPNDAPLFFATRQSSSGCAVCAIGLRTGPECNPAACTPGCLQTPALSNDVFGCGNFGAPVSGCGPLDRFSDNLCTAMVGSPWSCNAPTPTDDTGLCEGYTVVKPGPSHGGVLCCRDDS